MTAIFGNPGHSAASIVGQRPHPDRHLDEFLALMEKHEAGQDVARELRALAADIRLTRRWPTDVPW